MSTATSQIPEKSKYSCDVAAIEPKLEELIVKMARENSGWGYDRIVA